MNLLVLVVLTLLYIVFMVYLVLKLIDIFKNNEKYNHIKGWDKYRKSFWYEHESDYYNKGFKSKNYWAVIITNMPMWGFVIGLYYLLSIFIQQYLIAPENAIVVFRTDTYFWGIIGLIFFAIFYVFWICYNSKIHVLIASTTFAFNSKSRGGDWKKLIVTLMLIALVSLPLCILSIDDYGYVTNEKISYNPYLSIKEQDYIYDDIKEVTTSFSSDKEQTEFYFSYVIITKEDFKFDLATIRPKTIMLVNEFLQLKNITFNKATIDSATYQKMKENCKPETIQMVNNCFEIL